MENMAGIFKFSELRRSGKLLIKHECQGARFMRCFRTVAGQPKVHGSILKYCVYGAGVGVVAAASFWYKQVNQARQNFALEGSSSVIEKIKYKPPVEVSRKVISTVDTSGLKLTLFQYQSCPFCCKVRAFLDYYGIPYDIVEVNPVLRHEIKWSPYRKVPILLTKVNGGYQPLTDSSMIISLLASYLSDKSCPVENLVHYYPTVSMHDEEGKFKNEIVNKYFLMYQGPIPKDRTLNDIVEERKWRQWADDVFVHTLSPNVYRTLDEAYETFNWFSKIGRWEEYFPAWERSVMVNVGAWAMWLISKRLKRKHLLKDDVRESLYDGARHWMQGIRHRGTVFMGGDNPDLSDLAMYGVLKSIEGCEAFNDLLSHTSLGTWFNAVKEKVDSHAGSALLTG
ncbi:prostaglandin E synthase 2 [Orussus abietinus]|uniref:prostaglandin E synthase 2 n=1 Tax=Orussus abietinus TaxID=222816 RepID=UPI0006267FBD|nr:prostaglandin E synthase 2 [Orussus abietinus]